MGKKSSQLSLKGNMQMVTTCEAFCSLFAAMCKAWEYGADWHHFGIGPVINLLHFMKKMYFSFIIIFANTSYHINLFQLFCCILKYIFPIIGPENLKFMKSDFTFLLWPSVAGLMSHTRHCITKILYSSLCLLCSSLTFAVRSTSCPSVYCSDPSKLYHQTSRKSIWWRFLLVS